ncbi:hypothetical protein GCM10010919_02910 [Alishewanella longhuensis]|uniref:Uncharacterized protein n=1 Tax=Alishewanella longhuensis TaxID=1091037 RepID=A0ABQ3KUJ4_9ALTE|nr:hypothetical protein [Alishewanella longhuensis]GHG59935.1 hypothetical protein GCM10010919_02910 [Alishewanella longhuensis]
MKAGQWRQLNQQIHQLEQRIPLRKQQLSGQFRQCRLALRRSLSSPQALLLGGLTGFAVGLTLQKQALETKPHEPAATDASVASGFSLLPGLAWLWGWRYFLGWRWF